MKKSSFKDTLIDTIKDYIKKGTIVKGDGFGVIDINGEPFAEQDDACPDNYENTVKLFISYKSDNYPIKIFVAYPMTEEAEEAEEKLRELEFDCNEAIELREKIYNLSLNESYWDFDKGKIIDLYGT